MFVGGSDTTATSLEFTMAELMGNPTAMKKVQEEVRTVLGNSTNFGVHELCHKRISKTAPTSSFTATRKETSVDVNIE
ncbi:MAG: cytochrome P450, partial [Sweet potato little leaf phytoplasma]|nr:cytochrome P450 [Sweet potato little leaf phytoplasma]